MKKDEMNNNREDIELDSQQIANKIRVIEKALTFMPVECLNTNFDYQHGVYYFYAKPYHTKKIFKFGIDKLTIANYRGAYLAKQIIHSLMDDIIKDFYESTSSGIEWMFTIPEVDKYKEIIW